jgi:hypothetical protein
MLSCITEKEKAMRPRVFVSSVMDGFEEYRQAARDGIRAAGGEAVLAEDFPSLPVSSRTACLDGVASCDIYIAIVGGRGGWTAPSGKLVVEEEYEEARHRRLSILTFIQDTDRDGDAEHLARKLSDYIEGRFRETFSTPDTLQTAVKRALEPMIQHYARPEADTSVIEERLREPSPIRNETSIRFVLEPERNDELIDPVSLESEELEHQLFEIGHSPRVRLFSYQRGKRPQLRPDAVVIVQADDSRHRDGVDEVHLALTAQGLLAIDINVTGRAASNFSGHWNYFPVIVEDDVISALKKSFAFAHAFFETRDPYKRYDRFFYNVVLNGCQNKILMAKPPSGGGITIPMRHPDPDSVIAFDRPRVITREDFLSREDQAAAVLALLRRRLT